MQRYNNSGKEVRVGKKILSDFLGFLKYKVDNDLLTLEEEQALVHIIESGLPLSGTTDDFASYYHQAPVNVRSVINRKLLDRPIRKVLYPFAPFSQVVPDSWRTKKCCTEDADK